MVLFLREVFFIALGQQGLLKYSIKFMSEWKPFYNNVDAFEQVKYVRRRFLLCKKLLSPYLKEGVKILDIGGRGADFKTLLDLPVNYFVADIDSKALEKASARGAKGIKVNLNEFSAEKFPEKNFDILICAEVLEHLVDPRTVLPKLLTLLKENAVVLISLPNENTLFHRLIGLAGYTTDKYAFEVGKHLHFPTLAQSRSFVSDYVNIKKEAYHYNIDFTHSRFPFLTPFVRIVPEKVWDFLTQKLPNLFARGVIFIGYAKKQ